MKHVATSLSASESDPWTRVATNFDDLVDSPIVLGELDIRSFECGGVPHYLATLGGEPFWDSEKALQDVQKIVAKEQEFWGEVPYKSYWFLNLATEQGGGLEHDNSTVLMTSRFATKDKAKYQNWLGLVSHEFFHTWNVRRLRPKALVDYDYDREQYFRELWVAEGITSYYDDLFLPRTVYAPQLNIWIVLTKRLLMFRNLRVAKFSPFSIVVLMRGRNTIDLTKMQRTVVSVTTPKVAW